MAQEAQRGVRVSERWLQQWKASTSRTEVNIKRVRQVMSSDCRLIPQMIKSQDICLEDLGMRKFCAKIVLRLLDVDPKEHRMQVSQDFIECLQIDPNLLCRVITGDETWFFEYDPENNRQSLVEVTEADEYMPVKVKSLSHIDNVLRCEGYRPQRDLATGSGI